MKEASLTILSMLICLCRMKHILIETEDHGDAVKESGSNYNDYNHYYNDYNAGRVHGA